MHHLTSLLKGALIVCMIVIVGAVALGVVFRYVLNSPLDWTDEVSRYALVWMTFLGGALLFGQSDGHVRVDFFVNRFKGMTRRFATALSTSVELLLVALMTVGGSMWLLGSTRAVSAALGIPMPFVYAVIPLSGLAALLYIAARVKSKGDWPGTN